ncbi:MAG: glycosyltransferase family 4 protein [Gemmatimonadota bacterium]
MSLANIADGLNTRGHYAELMVGEDSNAEILRQRGSSVSVLPARNTGWKEVRALRRAIRRSDIRFIIADRPRDLRLAGLASPGLGVRLIYRYNVSRPRPPSDIITRLAYRRVAMTLFRSEIGARQVLDAAPFMSTRPHQVVAGGVDTRIFYPDQLAGEKFRASLDLVEGPLLLSVGALFPEKRYSELFRSVAMMKGNVPLLICGEGRLESELRAEARELRIDARFLGFLPPAELRAAYNAADIVVHTCAVETFGLSVSEAMACGRCVVAAAGGALPEVIHDAGVLVEPDDLAGFAGQVTSLLADRSARERLGVMARERSWNLFSLEKMVDNCEQVLQDLERD